MVIENLPSEVLIRIFESIDFDKGAHGSLHRISKRFHALLLNYGRSIAVLLGHVQYPTAAALHPSPPKSDTLFAHWAWLAGISGRQSMINSVLDTMGCRAFDCCDVSILQRGPWLRVLEAGLFINYRIADLPSYHDKAAHIMSLPLTSLALLFTMIQFALVAANREAAEVLNRKNMSNGERLEIHLCFEECCINHGPEFIMGMLVGKKIPGFARAEHMRESLKATAYKILTDEHKSMANKERGNPLTGTPPTRTLLSRVREGILAGSGCPGPEVRRTAWEVSQSDAVLMTASPITKLVLQG